MTTNAVTYNCMIMNKLSVNSCQCLRYSKRTTNSHSRSCLMKESNRTSKTRSRIWKYHNKKLAFKTRNKSQYSPVLTSSNWVRAAMIHIESPKLSLVDKIKQLLDNNRRLDQRTAKIVTKMAVEVRPKM